MALYDTPKKIRSATNEDGVLTGYVEVDFDELVEGTRADLMEKVERNLVGSVELSNITLRVASGHSALKVPGVVLLHVQGKPDLDSLPADEPEPTPAVEPTKD